VASENNINNGAISETAASAKWRGGISAHQLALKGSAIISVANGA